MSFADFLSLNGDEEQRLLDEAGARAHGLEDEAAMKLRRAQDDAAAQGVDLSAVASYQDYMRAKAAAQAAWAPQMPEADPRFAAVRQVAAGRTDNPNAMAQRFAGQEKAANDKLSYRRWEKQLAQRDKETEERNRAMRNPGPVRTGAYQTPQDIQDAIRRDRNKQIHDPSGIQGGI